MPSTTSRICFLRLGLFLALGLAACSKEPSEEQKQADYLLAKAKTVLSRGEYRLARGLLDSAITLDQNLSRPSRVAEEQWLLGGIFVTTGVFDSALLCYDRAVETFRNLADRQSVRSVTVDVASAQRQMGDDRKSFALCTEALRLANLFKDEQGALTIQWEMLPAAVALEARDDEKQILANLLNAYTASKDVRQQARVMYESGVSSYLRGDYSKATRDLLRSRELGDDATDSVLSARAILRLAMAYQAAGMSRECFQAYSDGLRRADRLRGEQALRQEMLMRVGNIYLRNRRFGDAARFYRAGLNAAIAANNKIAEGYYFILLGQCDLNSARESALKSYRMALDLFQNLAFPPGISSAFLSLGIAAKQSGQFNEAYAFLKSAADESEAFLSHRRSDDLYLECDQSLFGRRPSPAYDELLELLLQTGRTDEAFRIAERRNNRQLYEGLAPLDPVTTDETTNAVIGEFRRHRAERIGAEQQYVRLLSAVPAQKEVLGDVRDAIARAGGLLATSADEVVAKEDALSPFVRISSVGISEAQKQLPQGTALLEYVACPRSLYTFVITAGRAAVEVAAVTRDSVAAMAHEFTGLLQRREGHVDTLQTDIRATDRMIHGFDASLYQAFVRPIEGDIAGSSRLLVILPREASVLPLHALRRGQFGNSPYLAEQALVSYLPSARALTLNAAPPAKVRDVVGLGCPGRTSWDVEYELRDIRAFFKEARLYFGQQATLATLQKEHADVMHIAAEFHPDPASPGNAYVNLSDGESAESVTRVPLGELFSLPSYPTVVISDLSASRFGFERAETYPFLANGTRTVVMDGYVPSRKTKKYFGEIFYTALLNGETDQGAFRKVQLEMIRNPEYAAACSWAPFFMWGK